MIRSKRLNKTNVESLKPTPGKQYILWDDKLAGFGVRVSPGGALTYMFRCRINGEDKKVKIGRHGALTAEQARKQAQQIAGMVAKGVDPSRPKRANQGAYTFGDLLTAYADLLEARGKIEAQAVRGTLKKDVQEAHPKLWKKAATEITLDDCLKPVDTLVEAGKPRQADKLRSYIKTAFSDAIHARGDANMPKAMRELKLTSNPARELRKVAGSSNAKDRALSLAELRAYWRHVKALPDPRRSLAMLHVLTGGQRKRQLGRTTLADLDRDAPSLTLWDSKGRRQKARRHVVPLLPEALALIDGITGGGEYVFSCNGGESPIDEDYLNDAAKKVCEEMRKAGELEGEPFTAGVIRATIETRLAAKPYRVSSDVLAHLLSHGMGGVQARHYQRHDFFEEKLEALEMLWRMLEGIAEPGVISEGVRV